MRSSSMDKDNAGKATGDILVVLVIVLYCLSCALLRLFVSPSLELDEAQQFFTGVSFHLGYPEQAPLYNWIVWLVSLPFGKSLATLIGIKYSLIFLFYLVFYITVRSSWNVRESLLIMGTLLLFTTYSYEFNRDLSNTVLVCLMAVITCHFYVRLLRERAGRYYLLLGLSAGLGLLSKYNFAFFLAALLLSGLSTEGGRLAVFNAKILRSVSLCGIVVSPHMAWLVDGGHSSLRYAINLARMGQLNNCPMHDELSFFAGAYAEVIVFFLIVLLLMGKYLSLLEGKKDPAVKAFRLLALYGLAVPLAGIICFRPAHFQSRWLAPVFFTLPPAFFSFVKIRTAEPRFRALGCLCLAIAVAVLAARAFVGFFPDAAGKVERIHIPYQALCAQLDGSLKKAGVRDLAGLPVITGRGDDYIAGNIMAELPGTRFVPLEKAESDTGAMRSISEKGGLFVWNASKRGPEPPGYFHVFHPEAALCEVLSSPYIHSSGSPPFRLGVIIIPPK